MVSAPFGIKLCRLCSSGDVCESLSHPSGWSAGQSVAYVPSVLTVLLRVSLVQ